MSANAHQVSIAPRWGPGPARAVLSALEVHIWRAQLDTPGDLSDTLSDGEQRRAKRILGARSRRRWARSRGLLRAILALYLEQEPGELRFSSDSGKPRLITRGTDTRSDPQPAFSVSHSEGVLLVALSGMHAVGVDVELDRRELDELALARRAFGDTEAMRLRALAPRDRRREFLQAWTRCEAQMKLGGRLAPLQPAPWIIDLDVGDCAAAALALAAAPDSLSCWEWPAAASESLR